MATKNKKKVLFTSHTANFSKFNRPFMRWFKSQGYEVHYASAGEEEVLDCDKHFTISFERSPFKLNNLRAIKQLKKVIDTEGYDIIHTHTPMGSVVTRLAAKAARKKGTRVIYTAHGFHFFTGAPILNWLIYYPIEKVMAKYTDTLITINNEDYERAKRKFNTDVKYVPGVGIDPKKFDIKMSANEKLALRKSLGLKRDDFVILYIAELNDNKNQAMLLRTLKRLKHEGARVRLLLAGADSLNGKLQRMAAEYNVSGDVYFLGYRSDIPNLIKVTDLAITSSRREGLPVNVMEAMYVGLPVVATACRGNSDLVENGRSGFVVSQDDDVAAADAIVELKNDSDLRLSFSKIGKNIVKPYLMDAVISKMTDIYNIHQSEVKKQNEPIRVLHVVTIMNRAGLETMLMNYYRNIDHTKVQFDFLVHRNQKGDYDDEILGMGGRIHYAPSISLANISDYRKKLRVFFHGHPEYKIIHSHLDSLSALPLSVAKSVGVSTRIAHSHTSSFDKDIKFLIRNITKNFIKYYATDFLGCSTQAIQFMFGSKIENAKVINNAIDTSLFEYSSKIRREARSALEINNNQLVIGHVGRFNYPKNHDFLVDIFEQIHKQDASAVMLLVGNGEGEQKIKERVKALNLEGHVMFLGLRTDIAHLMQAMDIFVMPSRYEGLPVVSLEAQATGLPCFFSDVITTDLDVTGNSQFISLKESAKVWSTSILETKIKARHDQSKVITDNDYNIHIEAKKLEAFYVGKYV